MSKRNRKHEEHSSRAGAGEGRNFNGLRVFVVEDEALVSMLIEDTLADIGCSVAGTAARLDEAMNKAAALDFDLATFRRKNSRPRALVPMAVWPGNCEGERVRA